VKDNMTTSEINWSMSFIILESQTMDFIVCVCVCARARARVGALACV